MHLNICIHYNFINPDNVKQHNIEYTFWILNVSIKVIQCSIPLTIDIQYRLFKIIHTCIDTIQAIQNNSYLY